jgi:thiol:disulfide interchange protein
LYNYKEKIEPYLSKKTNELFDLQDKIILYDLTNTYFEGRKINSEKAKFGRSKEKRSDAKLLSLALVVNAEGFIKYSKIYSGNISEPSTLLETIESLSQAASYSHRNPVVVMDAGISTEDNLKMLKENNYDYLCVSRSKLKDYTVSNESQQIKIFDNKKQLIEIQTIENQCENDNFLHVKSHAKAQKEASMDTHFSEKFEAELNNIATSIHKKGCTKNATKIAERIGRIKERYPSANKHYTIEIKLDDKNLTWTSQNQKGKVCTFAK